MCQFASFYLTKTSEYYSATSESHTYIIREHGLVEDGARGPNGERVELIPPKSGDVADLATWVYVLDQDIHTDWHEADPDLTEQRARKALARRAAEQNWFGTATVGDYGTATAGYGGTATVGDYGTATAGYGGTATAGDDGTATVGDRGKATVGDRGKATVGDYGTATAGDGGTATAGYGGTATAGDLGKATAGYGGTATAGDYGTATAGDDGTATAGDRGAIRVAYYDTRARLAVGYVGEHGIEANVAYCVKNGVLVKVTQ